MKKFLFVIACIGLAYYFKPEFFSGVTTHFSSGAAEGEVLLFTYADCGQYCDDGLAMLQRKNISFTQYDVESEEGRALWKKMGGQSRFPMLVVGSEVGSEKIYGFNRSQWLHALAQAQGLAVFDYAQREAIATHFASDGSKKVVMYATEWCPYCKKARAFFADNNIAYTEVDVEKSSDGKRHYDALEASGYPLIYVGMQRFNGFGGSIPRDIKKAL